MAELFTTRDGRALCDLRERRGDARGAGAPRQKGTDTSARDIFPKLATRAVGDGNERKEGREYCR